MRVHSCALAFSMFAVCVGCQPGQNMFAPGYAQQNGQPGQYNTLQQQQFATAQQQQQLQSRASSLDQLNQQKEQQLAASRQDVQRLDAHVKAISQRLKDTAAELEQVRQEKEVAERKAEAALAATRQRGGALITAKNTLQNSLPKIDIDGVEVRPDNDVIRIHLTSKQLFETISTRLTSDAKTLLDRIAAEVARTYPKHIIGIEGHTDDTPVAGGQWRNNHELSLDRAMAVYDYLSDRGQIGEKQLHVVGHGANHPVYSNGTLAGREQNRRVELVIYPETLRTAQR